MPYYGCVDELAEAIADMCGVYGAGPEGDHPEDCKCRICFVLEMTERIRAAAYHDKAIRHQVALAHGGELAESG